MLPWITAVCIGVAAAAIQYGRPVGGGWIAAVLRAITIAGLVGLWFDAPVGRTARVRPYVALDVSASWLRGGDSDAYRTARREAAQAGADSLFLIGDSIRPGPAPAVPSDVRTRVRPAIERALAAGRPLVLVTDGEIDDPEAVGEMPAGSRVIVVPHATRPDGALATLDAPRTAVAGDTIEIRATVGAGAGGAPAGAVAISLAGRPASPATTVSVDALAPRVERTISVRTPVPQGDGPREVRAVWTAAGDADHHNDTLAVSMDVSPAAGAVFVSTSPDEDARYALTILRGALALPTRGYFRVAAGQWRTDGPLSPVSESDVRRAVAAAPLVVLQGDTAVFGAPLTVTRGALALLTGPAAGTPEEWFATGAPPSPLAGVLAGIPWDSLPPIDVGAASETVPPNAWQGLEVKRGRRFDRRLVVVGSTPAGRRLVTVPVSGLWRWSFRGGVSADAFAAFWGGVFDWLAAERRDLRPAVPADALVREGDPIRWRRGGSSDSVARLVIVPRDRPGQPSDSLVIAFASGSAVSESPPLPAGSYDVRSSAGPALLVVNPSREWLPRVPSVESGAVRGVALAGSVPHLRGTVWIYVLLVVLLCAEWLWRRHIGLR
jgi:hypothetical protein